MRKSPGRRPDWRVWTLPGVRLGIIALYLGLGTVNLLAWEWALTTFRAYPVLLGVALLAYTFGLRHAVDGEHIAAIDNVTRKLMQNGQRPVGVGLYFSLGHASVVVLASGAPSRTSRAPRESCPG